MEPTGFWSEFGRLYAGLSQPKPVKFTTIVAQKIWRPPEPRQTQELVELVRRHPEEWTTEVRQHLVDLHRNLGKQRGYGRERKQLRLLIRDMYEHLQISYVPITSQQPPVQPTAPKKIWDLSGPITSQQPPVQPTAPKRIWYPSGPYAPPAALSRYQEVKLDALLHAIEKGDQLHVPSLPETFAHLETELIKRAELTENTAALEALARYLSAEAQQAIVDALNRLAVPSRKPKARTDIPPELMGDLLYAASLDPSSIVKQAVADYLKGQWSGTAEELAKVLVKNTDSATLEHILDDEMILTEEVKAAVRKESREEAPLLHEMFTAKQRAAYDQFLDEGISHLPPLALLNALEVSDALSDGKTGSLFEALAERRPAYRANVLRAAVTRDSPLPPTTAALLFDEQRVLMDVMPELLDLAVVSCQPEMITSLLEAGIAPRSTALQEALRRARTDGEKVWLPVVEALVLGGVRSPLARHTRTHGSTTLLDYAEKHKLHECAELMHGSLVRIRGIPGRVSWYALLRLLEAYNPKDPALRAVMDNLDIPTSQKEVTIPLPTTVLRGIRVHLTSDSKVPDLLMQSPELVDILFAQRWFRIYLLNERQEFFDDLAKYGTGETLNQVFSYLRLPQHRLLQLFNRAVKGQNVATARLLFERLEVKHPPKNALQDVIKAVVFLHEAGKPIDDGITLIRALKGSGATWNRAHAFTWKGGRVSLGTLVARQPWLIPHVR